MKLSIAMIVKNEEKNLERTLKPLIKFQGYIDSEIVIVDTGSIDKTVEIAQKYTDKVFFHQWNDDFGDMRNISISHCSGEWVMIIDADEELYDVEELINLFKDENPILKNYGCIMVNVVDFQGDVEKSLEKGGISRVARIFKRKDAKFVGKIHEQPAIVGEIFATDIRFIHYGYDNNNYKLMEYKFNRNIKLLLENLKEKPNDIYTLYQIAVAYHMHKERAEALKYIKKAYEKCKEKNEEKEYVLHKYCELLYELQEYILLENIVKEANEKYDSLDYYFFAGEAFGKNNNFEKAIEMYEKYLKCYSKMESRADNLSVTSNVITKGAKDTVNYNLAVYYYKKGMTLEALEALKNIKDEIILKNNLLMSFKIIISDKSWEDLQWINRLVNNYNYEEILYYTHDELSLEELNSIDEKYLEGDIKEIIEIVRYFKTNGNINETISSRLKRIMEERKIPYLIYVYYILSNNIYDIKLFIEYGENKLETILAQLINKYYDMNDILMFYIKEHKVLSFDDIFITSVICRVMLLVGKISLEDKKEVFLNYLSSRYYIIVKCYKDEVISNKKWILSNDDKMVLNIKEILQKRYINLHEYINDMKEFIKVESPYINYINIFHENLGIDVNEDMKELIPALVKNIEALIENKDFQQAYNAIEEVLSLVRFDYDIMVLKLNLLIKFKLIEETNACFNEIILYGPIEKVNLLISNI